MQASSKLSKLEKSFVHRLRRLQAVIWQLNITTHDWPEYFKLAYIVIEMQNSWYNFARSYFLSYLKKPRLRSGVRLNCDPGLDVSGALGLVINYFKPWARPKTDGTWHRRDEPAWHNPHVLLTACSSIGASNLNDVQAAVSSGTRVFVDMPVFRNFFAHRNGHSQSAAMRTATQYGISPILRPHQILLQRPLDRPQALIHEWVDDLVFTAEYLCY